MGFLFEWLFRIGEAFAQRQAKRQAVIEESDRILREEFEAAERRERDRESRDD